MNTILEVMLKEGRIASPHTKKKISLKTWMFSPIHKVLSKKVKKQDTV